MKRFGTADVLAALNQITAHAAKRARLKIEPEDIQIEHGFISLFTPESLKEILPISSKGKGFWIENLCRELKW